MLVDAQAYELNDFVHLFWRVVLLDMGRLTKWAFIGCLCLIVFFLIFGKGQERRFFGVQGLILFGFCWNPWVMYYLCRLMDLSSRYFHYLWIMPVASTFGYFAVILIRKCGKKKGYVAVCYILSFVVLAIGARSIMQNSIRLYNPFDEKRPLTLIDNVYKVEADAVQISELVGNDKGDPTKSAKTLYGYDVFMDYRTYDASLYSGFSLRDQKRYLGTAITNKDLKRMIKKKRYKNALNLLINGTDPAEQLSFGAEDIREILKAEEYQYVIVPNAVWVRYLFEECGEVLGESEHYVVIKVV